MRLRHRLALVSALLVGQLWTQARAQASDERQACLSAADQGQSLRDEGAYSRAREQFLQCSRDSCPQLVRDQCADWLRELDESMPTVTFAAKDEHGNELSTVTVRVDGRAIASRLGGEVVAIDPGPHEIRFESDPPSRSLSVHVILRAGEKRRRIEAAFSPMNAAPVALPEHALPAAADEGGSMERAALFRKGRTITSLSLLGASAISVGLGVVFGLQSQNEAARADRTRSELGGTGQCAPNGNSNNPKCGTLSDAVDAQSRDTVLDIVLCATGGALAAGAAAAWFLWPRVDRASKPSAAWITPEFGPSGAGVQMGMAF